MQKNIAQIRVHKRRPIPSSVKQAWKSVTNLMKKSWKKLLKGYEMP